MRHDRLMARLTILGITIAVATLLVTLSIVNGFSQSYERALLGFTAHVTITGTPEIQGDSAIHRLHDLIQTVRVRPLSSTMAPRQLTEMAEWWNWGMDQYYRAADAVADWPMIGQVFQRADPIPLVRQLLRHAWFSHAPRRMMEAAFAAATHGVIAAAPFLYREGLLVGEGKIRGVVVKGVDPTAMSQTHTLHLTQMDHENVLQTLSQRSPTGAFPILVGSGFGLHPGARLQLFLPRDGTASTAIHKDLIPVRVAGLFEAGLHDYDSEFILIDLAHLQSLLQLSQQISGMELRLDDPAKAPWIAAALEQHASAEMNILPWQEMHRPILEAVALERLLLAMIVGILVAVAAFNILATVLLRCLRQHRSIAILRAIGLSAARARGRYFWWGFRTGIVGVMSGIALGAMVSLSVARFHWVQIPAEVYFLSRLPIALDLSMMVIVLGFGLSLCGFAAYRAAQKVTELPVLASLTSYEG